MKNNVIILLYIFMFTPDVLVRLIKILMVNLSRLSDTLLLERKP